MATYTVVSRTFEQRTIQIGDTKYPVVVANIDAGAELNDGDVITGFTNTKEELTGLITIASYNYYPADAGDPYTGSNIITDNPVTFTIQSSIYNNSISKWLAMSYDNTEIWVTAHSYTNNNNRFQSYYIYLIWDVVGQKFLIPNSWLFYVFSGYRERPPYNQYGIVNLDNELAPYGLIPADTEASYINNGDVTLGGNADVRNHLLNIVSKPKTVDPYEQGGTSGAGGGTGNFDLSSDTVDFPTLPTLTAVDTGLVSIYTPTLAQLKALATYMWNANPTDVDWWKKLVANPLDLILGLSIVPVAVPAGATNNVKVGLIDTGISMTRAATQFVEVDCGSLEVKEFWGSALDYSPFRKHSIYLPFIGTRTINTDDIMNKTVAVKYHVDLLSGALTALVKCGDAVLYQYSGACAVSLPLTGETFTSMITSTIQLAASLAGTIASGGAAAGITAAAAANSVMSMKPQIERAGGVSGAAGQLGIMTPYLIGEIPRQSVPENANTFYGYPSNIKATLGDLTGFTAVETVHLQNIPATAAEYAEIEQLLKEGVIL